MQSFSRSISSSSLITRNGHDWSARYPTVVAAVFLLTCRSCLIDGEVAVCGKDGMPTFDGLRAVELNNYF